MKKGYATRREADRLIEDGNFLNGKKAKLGDKVNESDKVELKGEKKFIHITLIIKLMEY